MADDTPSPPSPRRSPGLGWVLGAVLALVLVFAAVRLTSSPPPREERAEPEPTAPSTPTPFDEPTRGSLAGADGWLSGVAGAGALAHLSAERHVALATDAPGVRVALVLGRDSERLIAAWLTGPPGALPEQMALAARPHVVSDSQPLTLWDVPEPPRTGGLLVVVTRPGATVEFSPGRTVAADGTEEQVRVPLVAVDGVATASVDRPVAPYGGFVTVTGDDGAAGVVPQLSDRARQVAAAPADAADPRGLHGAIGEGAFQQVLHEMAGTYGIATGRLAPVLLAAGPVGDAGDRAVLVGATLPSGATVAWLGVAGSGPGEPLVRTVATRPAPAGAAVLNRVIAVPAGWAISRLPLPRGQAPPGWLVVSGPRGGTTAELLGTGEHVLGSLPLVDGAGLAPVPPGTATVRVLDASGLELGAGRVAELAN
jgi:hypothetical protein